MVNYLGKAGGYEAFVASRISIHVTFNPLARMLHVALGLQSEAGEFADIFKKGLTKATPFNELDEVNMKEELGDLLFYIQDAATYLNTSIEELAAINEAKLTKRYPNGFTKEATDNRNLEAERAVLEGEN